MSSVDRITGVAIALQLLGLAASLMGARAWFVYAIFYGWAVLIPVVGFIVGRANGKAVSGGLRGAAFLLTWFCINVIALVFFPGVSKTATDIGLTSLAGFAISCTVFAIVAFGVAAISAVIGRKFRVERVA